MSDAVEHPKHYNSHPSKIECILICERYNFNLGNAFKYLYRRDLKNDCKENVKKAIFYLRREAKRVKAFSAYTEPIDVFKTMVEAEPDEQLVRVYTVIEHVSTVPMAGKVYWSMLNNCADLLATKFQV